MLLGFSQVVNTVNSDAKTNEKLGAAAKFTVDSGVAISALRLGTPGVIFAALYFLADATGLNGGINRAAFKEAQKILQKAQK